MRTYWVYILASKPHGSLYIGVTNDLLGRVAAHRTGTGSKFTSQYGVKRLARCEPYADIDVAIKREKSLKRYARQWKINLIESGNPHWIDLFPGLLLLPGNHPDGACGRLGPRDKPEDDIGGAVAPYPH